MSDNLPPIPSRADPRSSWPAQIAAKLEAVTAVVEVKAVKPLVSLARMIVFGILALILLAMTAVIGSIALVRLMNTYIFTGQDWASLLLLGGILSVSGLFLWSRRTTKG